MSSIPTPTKNIENAGESKKQSMLPNALLSCLARPLRRLLYGVSDPIKRQLIEIRMAKNHPLFLVGAGRDYMVDEQGRPVQAKARAFTINPEIVERSLQLMAQGSFYALEEELKRGYLTLEGGHRVGFVGRAVLKGGKIQTIKQIGSLNIRIAREVIGAGNRVLSYLISKEGVHNTLILSPPCCGKTTLLRDLTRQISDGCPEIDLQGKRVGVVDERSELGACYRGVPQMDLGLRTDILDGCPKAEGMMLLIRSMSPEVIVTDELGRREDIDALYTVLNAGVRVVTTFHAGSFDDLKARREFSELVERRFFGRYVLLSRKKGPGTVEGIFDAGGNRLTEGQFEPEGRPVRCGQGV